MAVILTDYEQRMLAGEEGKLKQAAMRNIVKYAAVLGAEELCEVTKATLFCGAHPYLKVLQSNDLDEIFSVMDMCSNERLHLDQMSADCFCQTCVEPFDPDKWQQLGIDREDAELNKKIIEYFLQAGVTIVGACVPYLLGWLPLKGEHFVTSESHVVLLCNSLWGACGNGDGLEAGFWSAICGRTPLWGNHVLANRKGTHLFQIRCAADTVTDWDLIGYTIGRKLPNHGRPVLDGNFRYPDIIKLKQCFASMATTSDASMCHIVGFTPEAATLEMALGGNQPQAEMEIGDGDLQESLSYLCNATPGEVQFVALGCPQYSIGEIKEVADYIDGKQVAEGVNFQVWTAYPIKCIADECGYTEKIVRSGGDIYARDCPLGPFGFNNRLFANVSGMAFDGAKQTHYVKSMVPADMRIYYGSKYDCIDAAIAGKWRGGTRCPR